ncbi:hypothetical protein MMC28_005885 [Mycoblastus sanguinarius]|nr:hypothetical protein [Mycoblastus sanguinarius]
MDHGVNEKDSKAQHFIELLDQKRRDIDHEIADFKAKKERDYRVFEQQLCDQSKSLGEKNSVQYNKKSEDSKRKDEHSNNATGPTALAGRKQGGQAKANRPEIEGAVTGLGITGSNDEPSTARSNESPGGSPGPSNPLLGPGHGREKDFQGLFTPSYMQFLDGGAKAERPSSRDLLEAQSLATGERRGSTVMLSSSAENAPATITSPPTRLAWPLSESVPTKPSLHQRRNSSKSDLSIAGHRSSLRDPRQPRSPKRVLFSIDNTVVSPSTSPIAQRSSTAPPAQPSGSTDGSQSYENFEIVRNQRDNNALVNKPPRDIFGTSPKDVANTWNGTPSAFRRPMDASNSSPMVGGEEFEEVDDDEELFDFDEDMMSGDSRKPSETNGEDQFEDDVGDQEEHDDVLTTSSPHAGSLPIEIKWPARRDTRS